MSKLFMMLLMVISACLFSCSRENEEARIKEDIKNAFTLRKTEVNKTLNLPAELLPYERAEINARIEGYLRSVSVDIGDVVRKDEILALLDAPEIIARFAEANARSLEAEARLNASLDHYNRITTAAKQQGVVAEAELISTRNHMLADSAALLSARSTAEAYQQLQAYLTIRAPFNGIITSRSVDPGDLVGSAGKIPLMTIERPEILRLRIFVPESYVNNVPADVMITFTTESV
ncbi:MAG: efflux RND transporter periplasmic adaptor subunit, partial [Cyclobacteriaceae bacterium]|nr:efflux RND transporter periplasmic adaptor subunit [Cyclobacteriaceae bacterium]